MLFPARDGLFLDQKALPFGCRAEQKATPKTQLEGQFSSPNSPNLSLNIPLERQFKNLTSGPGRVSPQTLTLDLSFPIEPAFAPSWPSKASAESGGKAPGDWRKEGAGGGFLLA